MHHKILKKALGVTIALCVSGMSYTCLQAEAGTVIANQPTKQVGDKVVVMQQPKGILTGKSDTVATEKQQDAGITAMKPLTEEEKRQLEKFNKDKAKLEAKHKKELDKLKAKETEKRKKLAEKHKKEWEKLAEKYKLTLSQKENLENEEQKKELRHFNGVALPKSYKDITMFGGATLSKNQCIAYIEETNPNPKLNCSVREIVSYYWEEASREGIRPDIALAQALVETGTFAYGGDVIPKQNNFCGLGTTGGGVKGAFFKTPQEGVRAHIQHLLAYSRVQPPKTKIIDPRYDLAHNVRVTRGLIDKWSGLNGTWAMGSMYCEKIMATYQKMGAVITVPDGAGSTAPSKVEKKPQMTMRERIDKLLKEKEAQNKAKKPTTTTSTAPTSKPTFGKPVIEADDSKPITPAPVAKQATPAPKDGVATADKIAAPANKSNVAKAEAGNAAPIKAEKADSEAVHVVKPNEID